MPATTPEVHLKPDPVTEAALREGVVLRLEYIFRRAGKDSTMQALWRAMVDYRLEK